MKKCLLILLALSLKTCYTAEAGQPPLTAEEMALLLGVSEQPSKPLEIRLKEIATMDLRSTLRLVHPDRNQDKAALATAVSQKINSKTNAISALQAIQMWQKYVSGDASTTNLPDLTFCAANEEEMNFLDTKTVPWISEDDVKELKRIKVEREAQVQAAAAQAAAPQAYAAWQQQQAQAYAAWQQQQAQAAWQQQQAAAWLQQQGPWQQQQAQPTWEAEAEKLLGEEYLQKTRLIKLKKE